MKKHRLVQFYLCLFLILSFLQVQPVLSQASLPSPDAVIKIPQIDRILAIIDQFPEVIPNKGQPSPSVFLKDMFKGTDWIDSNRAIVIGAFLKKNSNEPPDAAALIPFCRPNDEFLKYYNAVAGNNYYIIKLPPGQGGMVSDRMEKSLVAASLNPPEELVLLDLSASQLIKKADPQIQSMLQSLEQKMPTEAADTGMSPKQVKQMLTSLIETGKQLETVSLGLDMTEQEIAFFCNAKAFVDSGMAEVFDVEKGKDPLILADYQPAYQMNFRSMPYDIDSVMDFFDKNFGPVYDQMGLDFGKLKEITKYFSGEMAGGASFSKNGLDLEVIAVFNDPRELPENYLESVYLPWVMNYGKTMAEFVSQQSPGVQVENLFELLPPSTVGGQSVVGLKGKMPVDMQDDQTALEFQLRMTRMNAMLLTASDDQRLERLIQKAKNLKKAPASGPFMQMDIDLSAYLDAINEFMPRHVQIRKNEIPELGNLIYTLDMTDGMLKTRYSMKRDAIKEIAGYFKKLSVQTAQDEGAYSHRKLGKAQEENYQARKAKAPLDKDNPQYWLNKGQLFATYGNERQAIEYYHKAIELDPNNGRAYFHLGVCYGDAGQYGQALNAINRAISLEPEDGDYYYARGWIYLRAGDKEKAKKDMQRAAHLGNIDAKRYLESIGKR